MSFTSYHIYDVVNGSILIQDVTEYYYSHAKVSAITFDVTQELSGYKIIIINAYSHKEHI